MIIPATRFDKLSAGLVRVAGTPLVLSLSKDGPT